MVIILMLLLLSILCSIVFWSWHNGISPMPTSSKVKQALLKFIPPEIHGEILELGSGWGTLVFPLARRFPHCKIIGYETSHIPFWISKIFVVILGYKNVELYRHDFFSINLRKASLVVCYLYPGAMNKLSSKFVKELKPGTWIVSNTFSLPGWKPVSVMMVNDLYHTKIYLYKV